MKLNEELSMDKMELTKEDIVNIAISSFETKLIEEGRLTEVKIEEISKAISEADDKLSKEKLRHVKKIIGTKIDVIIDLMSKLDMYDKYDVDITGVCSDKVIRYRIYRGNGAAEIHISNGDLEMPKDINKLRIEFVKLGEDFSKATADRKRINHDLANIATTERRARASLTTKMMDKYDDGQDIVKAIVESVNADSLRLGR